MSSETQQQLENKDAPTSVRYSFGFFITAMVSICVNKLTDEDLKKISGVVLAALPLIIDWLVRRIFLWNNERKQKKKEQKYKNRVDDMLNDKNIPPNIIEQIKQAYGQHCLNTLKSEAGAIENLFNKQNEYLNEL